MKKIFAAFAALAVVVALLFAAPALADGSVGPDVVDCSVPTVTITRPGEPVTIPAVLAKDAVYQRYQWNPKGSVDESVDGPPNGSTPMNDPNRWQESTSNYKGESLNTPLQSGGGNGGNNGSWYYWILVSEAVEAQPEKVIPGEPIVETVINPNYPCDEENPTVVTPVWSVGQSCLTPRDTWITANDTEAYDATVHLSSGYGWEIEFVANEGYEFAESDRYVLSDDKGRAVVTGRFLVVRCVVPHEPPVDEPEIGTPEVESRCSATKCVKITRDGSGKVVDRDVIVYPADVREEGL